MAAAYAKSGVAFPCVAASGAWNEFDLDLIYRELAPQLCAEDPQFRTQLEAMREQVRASRGAHDAEIHRRWTPCDVAMIAAWIRGTYDYTGESWGAFRQRVAAANTGPTQPSSNGSAGVAPGAAEHANVVVFTSATPTAVWAGRALDIHDERIMQLAGVLHNASYSIVRRRSNEQLQLFMFNAVPHLAAPELRTHR